MPGIKYITRVLRGVRFEKLNYVMGVVKQKSGHSKARTFCDILWCAARYGAGYYDYVMFGFYDMNGKQVGEVELSEAVFGIEPNESVVHDVVKNHLANCRQGTQSALTRAEVSGGGKKPWKQKGTGHARQGSTRAPQWTHGGIVFAPKPRDYSYTLNKKVKRLALKSVLSAKAAEGNVIVVDELNVPEIKTKTMQSFLTAVNAGKAVLVTPEVNMNVVKSARNIPGVVTTTAKILSVYDIVNAKQLVIDKAALAIIEEVYA